MKMKIPEGEYCYHSHIFTQIERCPYFNDEKHLQPQCQKFSKGLKWNVIGHVIKCDECVREDSQDGK